MTSPLDVFFTPEFLAMDVSLVRGTLAGSPRAALSPEVVAVTRDDKTLRRKFKKAHEYSGLVPRVAKKLGVTRQHVWAVFNNDRWSQRVAEALDAEIRRIEASGAKEDAA